MDEYKTISEVGEQRIKAWMRSELDGGNFIGAGQEIDTTLLAEYAADTFNIYEDNGGLSLDVPEELFELASDVADYYEHGGSSWLLGGR